MSLYQIGTVVIWAILVSESILALALLFSGISFRLRQRRTDAETVNKKISFLNRLKAIQHLDSSRDIKIKLKSLKDESRAARDVPSRIIYYLLTEKLGKAGIERIIQAHIDAIERGTIRLCAFLSRTAPLAGLAGTLVGVQHALAAYSRQVNDPSQIVIGFSTALVTTLVGVLIAILCVSISRLIWEPSIKKTISGLFEFGLTAQSYVCQITEKVRGDN